MSRDRVAHAQVKSMYTTGWLAVTCMLSDPRRTCGTKAVDGSANRSDELVQLVHTQRHGPPHDLFTSMLGARKDASLLQAHSAHVSFTAHAACYEQPLQWVPQRQLRRRQALPRCTQQTRKVEQNFQVPRLP
jgi:hypothetical protein